MVASGAQTFGWAGALPGEPSSAGVARRVVADLLRSWGLDGLVDTATLLVSEVVTNAILHAGSDLHLSVIGGHRSVRLEVTDESTVAPSLRPYRADSVTGHGLELMDTLSSGWGVEATPSGKRVWFELSSQEGQRRRPSSPEALAANLTALEPEFDAHHTIRLERVPPDLVLATLECGDALLRELALLNLADEEAARTTGSAPEGRLDLTGLIALLDDAVDHHRSSVDLEIELPTHSADAALDLLALVDEAERLAADGLLLALPALPEIGRCRRWLLGEIALQLQGADPTEWTLPPPARDRDLASPLEAVDLVSVEAETGGVVVADHNNRIIFANPVAAELLGWEPEELVGYRVTTLIPPGLREAHLSGFTRFQLTGRSRILGQPIEVSGLHRDGSEVPLRVQIDMLEPHGDGRRLFRARMERG